MQQPEFQVMQNGNWFKILHIPTGNFVEREVKNSVTPQQLINNAMGDLNAIKGLTMVRLIEAEVHPKEPEQIITDEQDAPQETNTPETKSLEHDQADH